LGGREGMGSKKKKGSHETREILGRKRDRGGEKE